MSLTIKRLSESGSGLAIYRADPITGAVNGVLPRDPRYLAIALDNAIQAGTYFSSGNLPVDGLSENIDLNLDLENGFGILLIVNDDPTQIYSSFSEANPNNSVQFVRYANPDGGLTFLIENTLASDVSRKDYNDLTVKISQSSGEFARIPNSNPWINSDQTTFISLSDLRDNYRRQYEGLMAGDGAISIEEFGDQIVLSVKLVLNRREVDHAQIERSAAYPFQRFYSADELLYLSYQELSEYTARLSRQDLVDLYGADPATVVSVVNFLRNNGAFNIDTHAALEERSVSFDISLRDLNNNFTDGSIQFASDDIGLRSYFGHIGTGGTEDSYLIAKGDGSRAFADSVLGFEVINIAINSSAQGNAGDNSNFEPDDLLSVSFLPLQVAQSYQIPGSTNPSAGIGTRIGLIGSGGNQAMLGWQSTESFKEYMRLQGRNPDMVPAFQSLAPEERDVNGSTGEQMLDIAVLASISPGATIVATGNENGNLYQRYASLIYHDTPVDVISSSVQDDAFRHDISPARDQLYLDAVLRGITIAVASGDRGIATVVDRPIFLPGLGRTNPTIDTGSAAVLSVGGTAYNSSSAMLIPNSPLVFSPNQQNVWNGFNPTPTPTFSKDLELSSGVPGFTVDDLTKGQGKQFFNGSAGLWQGITGSGEWQLSSNYLPAGYQRDYLTGVWGESLRTYPDISMLSGGNRADGTLFSYIAPNYDEITGSYVLETEQGTSAAAPLVAGLLANIISELRQYQGPNASLAFVNPLLYELYDSALSDQVFFDVPSGSNNSNVFVSPATPDAWDGIYVAYKILTDSNGNQTGIEFYPLNGTLPDGHLDAGLSSTGLGFDGASGLGSVNGEALRQQIISGYYSYDTQRSDGFIGFNLFGF